MKLKNGYENAGHKILIDRVVGKLIHSSDEIQREDFFVLFCFVLRNASYFVDDSGYNGFLFLSSLLLVVRSSLSPGIVWGISCLVNKLGEITFFTNVLSWGSHGEQGMGLGGNWSIPFECVYEGEFVLAHVHGSVS